MRVRGSELGTTDSSFSGPSVMFWIPVGRRMDIGDTEGWINRGPGDGCVMIFVFKTIPFPLFLHGHLVRTGAAKHLL